MIYRYYAGYVYKKIYSFKLFKNIVERCYVYCYPGNNWLGVNECKKPKEIIAAKACGFLKTNKNYKSYYTNECICNNEKDLHLFPE